MRGTTAVVYSEAFFGTCDGKTANGLVRHSERYEILSVIDSTKAGRDAGEYLDEVPNGIPICADLAGAVAAAGHVPDFFILGVAPLSGLLSPKQRRVVLDAMARGMSVVNGLHEFLNEDPEFAAALSHPAYLSSAFILRGGRPDAVILQHAPARPMLGDYPDVPTPTPLDEIALLRAFAGVKTIGLTINHEDMTDAEVSAAIILYELELGIPATDALTRPSGRLVDMVLGAFPRLEAKLITGAA